MAISHKELLEQLNRYKNAKGPGGIRPGRPEEYAPLSLGLDSQDSTIFQNVLDRAEGNSARETHHVAVMEQNERNFQQMKMAQERLERAQAAVEAARELQKQRLRARANPQPKQRGGRFDNTNPGQGLSKKDANMVYNLPIGNKKGKWKDPTPFNINAGLRNFKTPYGNIKVNRSIGDNFVHFLRALNRSGYKVTSLGSYANRNIAGTNTRSLHSYGLAIDINPSQNPVAYGKVITNLPAGVGRLAAKYGLAWGGNWNGSKKDPMHFSKPWFGTK